MHIEASSTRPLSSTLKKIRYELSSAPVVTKNGELTFLSSASVNTVGVVALLPSEEATARCGVPNPTCITRAGVSFLLVQHSIRDLMGQQPQMHTPLPAMRFASALGVVT